MSVWEEIGWDDEDRREVALDRLLVRIEEEIPPTPAELRVIVCLSHGVGDQGAADMCGITYESARSHKRSACRRMAAKNTAHLVALCLRKGLID